MKYQLDLIFKLHQIDQELCRLQEDLAKIPLQKSELESELGTKKSAFEVKSAQIEVLEKSRREKERAVETSQARLNNFQGKLSEIKTNKEYQAATKEMDEGKKNNKILEEQILVMMQQLEGIKAEAKEIEESLQGVVSSYESRKKELDDVAGQLQAKIGEFDQSREGIVKQMEPKFLNLYQRVRKSKADAVVFVESGACQGCHMRIPPQLYIEIQKLKNLFTCPTCHRILYLLDWAGGEKKEVAQEAII